MFRLPRQPHKAEEREQDKEARGSTPRFSFHDRKHLCESILERVRERRGKGGLSPLPGALAPAPPSPLVSAADK